MFGKKDDAPVEEASLADVRLRPEELLVLLGGQDRGGVAVGDELVGRAVADPDVLVRWRRRMLRHLRPLGLVDEDGTPQGALAAALPALTGPGRVLLNGRPGQDRAHGGPSFEVCVAGGHAAALYRPEGRLAGSSWLLVDFEGKASWEGHFRGLRPFDAKFSASRHDQLLLVTGDDALDCLSAVELADYAYLREFARVRHVSQEPLIDLAQHLASAGGRWPVPMGHFFASDDREAQMEVANGIRTGRQLDGFIRTKEMRVWPTLGAVYAVGRAPRPGARPADWETPEGRAASTFARIDFLPTRDTLLKTLLAFDDYPAEEPDDARGARKTRRRAKASPSQK